jgi:anti-anti-sigma factor
MTSRCTGRSGTVSKCGPAEHHGERTGGADLEIGDIEHRHILMLTHALTRANAPAATGRAVNVGGDMLSRPQPAPGVCISTTSDARVGYVRPIGELDLAAADAMATSTNELLSDDSVREVVIDVTLCNSSGIRLLVKAYHAGQVAGILLYAQHAQPAVAQVLTLTGVSEVCSPKPPADDQQRPTRAGQVTLRP